MMKHCCLKLLVSTMSSDRFSPSTRSSTLLIPRHEDVDGSTIANPHKGNPLDGEEEQESFASEKSEVKPFGWKGKTEDSW